MEIIFSFIRKIVPTLVAVATGWIMFLWQSALSNPNTPWGRLLEHIGTAFWVTGIVILLYEYGAKEKKVHDSLNTLNELIKEGAGKSMELCFSLLFRDDKGNCPDHLSKAHLNLTTLIERLLELQHKKLWARDKYIDFINYLLAEVVLRNANNLVEISGIGNKSFHVPPAEEMADRILAAHMSAMEEDNSYDVISDLGSWQNNQLSEFRRITKERVDKGVTVRRVFNVLQLDRALDRMITHNDYTSKISDLRKILTQHVKDSKDWGIRANGLPRYEIKVIGQEDLSVSEKRKYLEDMGISNKHFGLFDHGDGIVQFTVAMPNLSDMALSADLDRIEGDRGVFNAVWNYSSNPLDDNRLNSIIGELEGIVIQRRVSEASASDLFRNTMTQEIHNVPGDPEGD